MAYVASGAVTGSVNEFPRETLLPEPFAACAPRSDHLMQKGRLTGAGWASEEMNGTVPEGVLDEPVFRSGREREFRERGSWTRRGIDEGNGSR